MPEARRNLLEKLGSAPLCCALQERLDGETTPEEVRACVLSSLPGPSASLRPIGFGVCWDRVVKQGLRRLHLPRGVYSEDRSGVCQHIQALLASAAAAVVDATAETLQWFFTLNYPLFRNNEYFKEICCLGLFRQVRGPEVDLQPAHLRHIRTVWRLLHLWVCPHVADVYNALPLEEFPQTA